MTGMAWQCQTGKSRIMNIYDELGVKRYINAMATVTILGGSIMRDEVLSAMREASQSYVHITDLHKKVGDVIAKLTNNEAAFISNGAASGILLATAACIVGDDLDKKLLLPVIDDMKNEILIYGPKPNGYDRAIRGAGGKIVHYGSEENTKISDLERAITDKTAGIMIFYFEHMMDGQIPVSEQVKLAGKYNLPVIVDAAAQIPRKENLWRYTRDMGADAALFSGGKGLRGPQSSGLVVGKKEFITKIAAIASPNGGIGRPMKVGREEIIGLMTAIKLYMAQDEDALLQNYEKQIQKVIDAFADEMTVEVNRKFPCEAGQPMPWAQLKIKENALKINTAQMEKDLIEGEPGIYVAHIDDALLVNAQTLQEGEIDIVIQRMKEIIDENRL